MSVFTSAGAIDCGTVCTVNAAPRASGSAASNRIKRAPSSARFSFSGGYLRDITTRDGSETLSTGTTGALDRLFLLQEVLIEVHQKVEKRAKTPEHLAHVAGTGSVPEFF